MTPAVCKVCGREVACLWWTPFRTGRTTLWCWQCSSCWIEHERTIAADKERA